MREWGIRESIVEKDYVIGWVLWGIASDVTLRNAWIFKGGTCLKKCYIETYRFSEDLDFTVMPDGPVQPDQVPPILQRMLERVGEESGIDFSVRAPQFRARPSGRSTYGRIYYRGPLNTPGPASIKIDLDGDEQVLRPTVLRRIAHAYSDEPPSPAEIRCYSFEELFAEKIRAMGERTRPRDLYDIVNLFRRPDPRSHPELIQQVLIEKCQAKKVPVPSFAVIEASPHRAELESEWTNMLVHQLPALPPFEQFWEELPSLFSWLEETAIPEELAAIPIGTDEDATWKPPATVWTWGAGVPLEVVRFAAVNHLCIELGYQGTTRLIEPYSLRRTRAGYLLLHAIKVASGELRAYRVDRIQSVKVTTRPFRPVYAIEFSPSGPLSAPPTRRTAFLGTRSRTKRAGHGGLVYVIQCPICDRKFKRTTSETRLRPHKDKTGWRCSGRQGYLVDTQYT